MRNVPIGAYDEPPPAEAMPPLSYRYIGENTGPFRTKEYAQAFKWATRWRDQLDELLP